MKTLFGLLIVSIIFMPVIALAQQPAAAPNACSKAGIQAAKQSGNVDSTLPRCINQIYKWSLGIGALLALLMIVVGGYRYMTSAGNAEAAGKGTEMIWGAIIGLCLLFGAYLLLRTINPDLVNFHFSTEQLKINPDSSQNPSTQNSGSIRGPNCPNGSTTTTDEEGRTQITCNP